MTNEKWHITLFCGALKRFCEGWKRENKTFMSFSHLFEDRGSTCAFVELPIFVISVSLTIYIKTEPEVSKQN